MRRRNTLRLGLAALLSSVAVACGERERSESTTTDAANVAIAPAEAPPPAAVGGIAGGARGEAFGGKAADADVRARQAGPAERTAQLGQQQPSGVLETSMIIRTGSATIEVDSLEPAVAAVQALALRVGGFVADISMQTGREQLRQAQLRLRVPANRFDEAVTGLRPIGKVEAVNVTAEDVGEEYVDVSARVANARRLEERLITLLATRTGRLEDVLQVERELARVREEIERYEGRLRYLRSRAAVSTLVVTVHEPAPILGRAASRNPIVAAFRDAWRHFVNFVAGFIEMLGILVPLAALALVVWLLARRFAPWRRRGGDQDRGQGGGPTAGRGGASGAAA